MSALDQIQKIQKAAATNSYDVIGVDVADVDIVTPVINRLVDQQYDEDLEEKAYIFTKEFLSKYPDLNELICCNMSNPVGAGRAALEAGKQNQIVITGMDHDKRALEYLRDGVIYALALQDCYSIGFDTIATAVKIADGFFPEKNILKKQKKLQQFSSRKMLLSFCIPFMAS